MTIPDSEIIAALRHADSRLAVGPSVGRVAARDYPVQRLLPRPILMGGASATALAAAGTGVVLALSTGASSAFAGWSATPTTASEAQIAQAESICMSSLASAQAEDNAGLERPESQLERERNQGGSRIEDETHDANWQTLLADTRGPYTAFLLKGDEGDHGFCMIGPGSTPLAWVRKREGPETTVEAGAAVATEAGARLLPGEGDFLMLSGPVGEGVTAIVYHLTNGTNVSATVDNGRYLVWWPPLSTARDLVPISQEVTSTTITNREGSTTTAWNGKDDFGEEF